MFTSFLKTALRFLWRNRSYTILNYLCLTFGLTCSIVALMNVTRILGYDRFHKNYDRLHEIEATVTYFNGDRFPKELLSASLPEMIRQNVPEIQSLCRVTECNYQLLYGNDTFSEKGIYADPEFNDLFTFPMLGSRVHPGSEINNSIIISEHSATRIFKTTDCIGKSIVLQDNTRKEVYTVSGVMKDVPEQSYLQFDFILPYSKYLSENRWALETGATATTIWALLSAEADMNKVNWKLKDLIKGQESTLNQELFLFPLREKMLYFYAGGRRVWREMKNLVLITAVGIAILLIACFNFINLSIALNIRRYKEAGIRQVLGARRRSVIFQHLGETSIITLLSLITAIDLVNPAIGALNRISGGNIGFNAGDIRFLVIIAGAGLFTVLAAGLLPALYLSSSRPATILKEKTGTRHSFSIFRQGLIVFQFTIPIVLVIFVLIVKTQDSYMRKLDLGFDRERLLIIDNTKELEAHSESLRNDLLSLPEIESVSFTNCVPACGASISNEVDWDGKDPGGKLHFWNISTDLSYADAVSLKISDGRFFDSSFPADSGCYLINDIAASVMGYNEPVGRTLTLDGRKGTIIGVFRDFHTISLSGPYTPTIISLSGNNRSHLLVKFSKGSFSEVSGKIRAILGRYAQGSDFHVTLYSDIMKRTELTAVSYLIGLAFLISIFLACLGLYGLASFTAVSRTKEIGIRKINGASVVSIMRLLGFNYSRWLILGSIISVPLAFLLGNAFLSGFNFRTPLPYWAFIVGPSAAYLIAVGSVSWQSWKAAARNPVDALRYE